MDTSTSSLYWKEFLYMWTVLMIDAYSDVDVECKVTTIRAYDKYDMIACTQRYSWQLHLIPLYTKNILYMLTLVAALSWRNPFRIFHPFPKLYANSQWSVAFKVWSHIKWPFYCKFTVECAVKELWKSVNIWLSYNKKIYIWVFLWLTVYSRLHRAIKWMCVIAVEIPTEGERIWY